MASYYESINFENDLRNLYNDITSRQKEDLYENVFTDGWQDSWFKDIYKKYSDMLAKAPTYYRENALQEIFDILNQYKNQLNTWHGENMADYSPSKLPGDDKGDDSLTEPEGSANQVGNNVKDETGNSALADMQKAIQTGLQQQQQQAQQTASNAAAAGVSKSQAGTLSDQATQQQQTQNVGAMYAANNSQRSSTQADYLEKMQQVANLEQQAKWAKKAEGSATMAGAISGGVTGLGAAATLLGGSDERLKKAPRAGNKKKECPRGMLNDSIDEKDIRKAIKQFKELYSRLKALKEAK